MANPEPLQFNFLRVIQGWIFPGLGHILAGNRRRGAYAMSGVLFLFVCGLLVGGIDAVDRKEDRLWFIGQAACGPITFAADFANGMLLKSGRAAPMVEMPPTSANGSGAMMSSFKGLAHANEFGILLVFLAGMLNVCVMLDAGVREPGSDAPLRNRRDGERIAS